MNLEKDFEAFMIDSERIEGSPCLRHLKKLMRTGPTPTHPRVRDGRSGPVYTV